jgi:predicted O-methyltransferase YrrM
MSTLAEAAGPPRQSFARRAPARIAPALYALTLFTSALLLFAVQPMFTKMLLPRLGGAPAVWSVAVVVFQAALLVGYAYAHLLARTLRPAWAALVHLAFLAAAATALPIGLAHGFDVPPENGLVPWLVALTSVSIGLPFVALSASAPLLQSWFAASGHRQAANPYVLYAASNVGSFAALIAYPFVIEPLMTLRMQAWVWTLGYAGLVLLIAATALFAARGGTIAHAAKGEAAAAPTLAQRLAWIALAAVPSGLVIAVTAHITTDVAAAPFLWVLPLALYLLTFVALFRDRPWIGSALVARLTPFAVAPLAIGILAGSRTLWLAAILLHLVAFFLLALACHGELYRRRPQPARLTEFYLWTSLGGVIGGVLAGLVAPHIFNSTYEYPILIVAALLGLPGAFAAERRDILRAAGATVAALAVLLMARLGFDPRSSGSLDLPIQIGLLALGTLMLLRRDRPIEIAALALLAFTVNECWRAGLTRIETARSFFGVHQIVESADRQFRLLYHGTTIHGAERIRNADGTPVTGRPQPRTYYYFGGPISEGIEAARAVQGGLKHVAAVGLGTGSLACHRREGEHWTFFEIDPEVVRIARDPRLFRLVSACAPDLPIVLGDARITLTASPQQYDLIVLDAFSSDSIPVHLLTREAFAGYLTRLAPHGAIVAHISNRHMELGDVVAAVGAANGLATFLKQDESVTDPLQEFHANSLVAVLARDAADVAELASRPGWRRIVAPDPAVAAWTDDYSNLLGAIARKKLGR